MDGSRTRAAGTLTGLLLATACGAGEPTDSRARIDLLEDVSRVRVDVPDRPAPAGVRLVSEREGLATVRVALPASAATLETSAEPEPGRAFDWYRWSLPWPAAPDLLCSARAPVLDGLDLPRMTEPGEALDPTADGVWYLGDDGRGPCLLVTLLRGVPLPDLALSYTVLSIELAGTPLAAGRSPALLGRVARVRGEATERALAVPGGSRVLWPLGPPAGRRLRGVLAASGADLRVRSTGGGEPWTAEVPLGREVPLDLEVAAGVWELEVEGPPEGRLWIQRPALQRPRAAGDPPNVVLVLVDTLRADRARQELMPALAGLAEESLVFSDCWATCSWTLPSVSTLFTGAHGGQHRAWLNDRELADGIDTLAEVFSRAGYATAAFTGGVFVDQSFGLDRGFDLFDSSAGGAGAVFGRATDWLRSAGDGPWFLVVHTYEVHSPYQPPPEAAARVLAEHPGVLAGRPPEPQAFFDADGVVDGDPDAIAGLLADLYDEEVRYTDGVLGAFLEELEAAGALDRGVLAVTSDHGEEFGEHGLFGHTDSLYGEVLHVPLVLHLPGGARAGEVDARPVSQIDFAPTLLDAAGLGDRAPSTFAGVSLLGGATPSPTYATRNIEEVGILRALRSAGCSLVEGPYIYPRGVEGPELYDLSQDPMQHVNVHGEDPRTGALEERLAGLRERYEEPLVVPRVLQDARLARELEAMGYRESDE